VIASFWDHSGKPSVFVVKENGEEIYRGPFKRGYEIIEEKTEYYRAKKRLDNLTNECRV
jgi:hypothetical protein